MRDFLLLPDSRRRRPAPARQPRVRRAPWRREHGTLAALEGVFVALLMVTSVAIVATMESKGPSIPPSRAPMQDTVGDLLRGLEALSSSDRYSSQMERAIAQAILGNTTALDRMVDRTMPVGTECRLWIDNGKARRLLAGPAERTARESVSASVLYHPEWAYAFVVPSLQNISDKQPLDLQGFAVSQGALVKEAGVPLQVTARTLAGDVYGKAAITSLQAGPSASVYLLDDTGQPTYVHREIWDLATQQGTVVYNDTGNASLQSPGTFTVGPGNQTLAVSGEFQGEVISLTLTLTDPNGLAYVFPIVGSVRVGLEETAAAVEGTWNVAVDGVLTGGALVPAVANLTIEGLTGSAPLNLTVVLTETSGVPLPAGTRLTVELPSAFDMATPTSTNQSGWTGIVRQKSTALGNTVSAELASPLANGARNLSVKVMRPTVADTLYHVQASLDNGTTGRFNLNIATTSVVVTPMNPIERGVHLNVPKPLVAGAANRIGVAFNTASVVTGLAETVTQLDVVAPGGEAVFEGVVGVAPPTGWSLVSPSHIRWTGTYSFLANAADDFMFLASTTANRTADEPAKALPLAFRHGSEFGIGEMVRPYIYSGTVPPHGAWIGYEIPSGGAKNATLGVEWHARAKRVTGNATYSAQPTTALEAAQDALRIGLAESLVVLDRPSARIGEPVNVTASFQGLLDNLDALVSVGGSDLAVVDWSVELLVLDPAQPFTTEERWEPVLKATVTGANASLDFTPGEGSFYGPHAVLAQAKFGLRSLLTGNVTYETARLLTVIDVLPDGGQSETALYWVSLECWLPDWQ